MLHHLSFGVTDMDRSIRFYDAVMAALGYRRVWTDEGPGGPLAAGYGLKDGEDKLALKLRAGAAVAPGPGFHVAFAASSRQAVDQFHAAAMANGGSDNGAPGLRPHYGPNYYAAFVTDPDGFRIEAVITIPLP